MRVRHPAVLAIYLLAAMGWWGVRTALAPAAGAPNPAQQPAATAPGVIKAEANLVLVDVIATDKKGNYIEDLEVKEFHVFEDNKEQPITSFSRATEAKTSAPEQKRYLVLFFDNSTMASGDQMRARQAAGQFVEKSTSVGCQMAVVDFGGAIRIAQNFTSDPERLKRAVAGIKFSAVQPNAPSPTIEVAALGAPSLSRAGSDFGARSVLLAIREVAKILRGVPGRKTLILFSGGFQLTPERESEVRATIDALNKANVAVYPIDIRGLQNVEPLRFNAPGTGQPPFPPGTTLNDSAFPHQTALLASLTVFPEPSPQQRPSGGAGGAGTAGGGTGSVGGVGGAGTTGGGQPGGTGGTSPSPGGTTSTGGGRSGGGTSTTGTTGTNPTTTGRGGGSFNPTGNPVNSPYDCVGLAAYTNSNCTTRQILPTLESAATNQQVLYQLAAETGGFHIFNTNDFLTGLTRILKELDQYYILGYVPPSQEHDGNYHRIRVKVDRKGVQIRSRNGYYDLKSPDLLAGKPEGKVLEERAASPQPGDIPVSLRAPYFYTSPGVARVNLTLEIPGTSVDFEKAKGNLHSQVNVLGIAYRGDGSVAARFSDAVKLDYEKKEWKEFSRGAFSYRNTFNIAPGKYNLKVVLGAGGEKFGKYEVPLTIEPFDGKEFQLAGPALSNQVVPVSQLTAKMDAALLDERTPLVFQGQEIVPSSRNRFRQGDRVAFYVEVYEPLLETSTALLRIGVLFDIVNRKTNQPAFTSNTILVNDFAQQGNPLVPVALKVPMDQLKAGEYRLEVLARDSVGNASPMRTEDFAVD